MFSIASLSADPVIDGILGSQDDYSHAFSVSASVEKGPTIDDAELYLHKAGNGDMSVLLRFPRSLNDNSYGETRIGWGKNVAPSGKNHNWSDLEGSDKGDFTVFLSGGGSLEFTLDFIDDQGGTLVHGLEGEGGVSSGSASDILSSATSLSYNFARFVGDHPELFEGEADSPQASNNYEVVDSEFDDWEFSIIYEFKIRGGAIGSWDPAEPADVLLVGTSHHSPNKLAKNKVENFEVGDPIDAPGGGGGGGDVPDVFCAVNTAENCGEADLYGMWIPNLHDGQTDRTFEFSDGEFSGLSSGDARLTAIAKLGNGNGFSVDVTFSGRTTHPGNNPKGPIDPDCYTPDTSDWFYYETFSGTLTGLPGTAYAGAVIHVERREKAFQVGVGANRQTNDMGASGWFNWELQQQTTTGTTIGSGSNGDFNFAMEQCTPALPTVSVSDERELECEGPMTFTICLSGPSANPVTVNYETEEGSAKDGDDYTGVASSIVIPAGATCAEVSVTLLEDDRDEGKESFNLKLTSATGATIADGEGKVEIENCEPEIPEITIEDITVLECDGPAIFRICLSELATQDITVDYKTKNGSARDNSDYTKVEGTLTIKQGEECAIVEVPITPDPRSLGGGGSGDSGDEDFDLELKNPEGAIFAGGEDKLLGTATILECEVDDIGLSISDASVFECNGPIRFEVCLDEAAPEDFSIALRTTAGTASSGDGDYDGFSSRRLNFEEGETCKFFEVVVNEDQNDEGVENFTVSIISVPDGIDVTDGSAIGTITDCDQPPTIADDLCVVDTGLNCGEGAAYSMWIPNLHDGHTDKTFEMTSGQFTGLQTGDAQLIGIATLGNGNGFIVNVTFTGRTVIPPAGSPKLPLDDDCYDMDASD